MCILYIYTYSIYMFWYCHMHSQSFLSVVQKNGVKLLRLLRSPGNSAIPKTEFSSHLEPENSRNDLCRPCANPQVLSGFRKEVSDDTRISGPNIWPGCCTEEYVPLLNW